MKYRDNTKPVATLRISNLEDISEKEFSDLSSWLAKTLKEINRLHITKKDYSNNPSWRLFLNRKVLMRVYTGSIKEKAIAKLAAKQFTSSTKR